MDADESTCLRHVFTKAKSQRQSLESFPSSSDATYQQNVLAAIESLEECRRIARSISLFSANETLEDVASGDLP